MARLRDLLYLSGAIAAGGGLLYVGGPVRHPFPVLWGAYALAGGLAALLLGRAAARGSPKAPGLALVLFSLLLAAQAPALAGYAWLPRAMPAAFPAVLLPAAGHLLLAAASAAGWAAAAGLLRAAGRSLAAEAARAAAVTAVAAASPFAVVPLSLAAASAAWPVRAEPPPGSAVPVSASFRFTWPAWLGYGTGGAVLCPEEEPPYVPGSTAGGPGYLELTPMLLPPGCELTVEVYREPLRRRFRYRVAPAADERVDLYRSLLAHWFRAPQEGFPGRLDAVAVGGMAELTPEARRAVAAAPPLGRRRHRRGARSLRARGAAGRRASP